MKAMLPLALLLGAGLGGLRAEPALTIYNQDFAVVRDTVPLDLKAGVNDVSFAGTTAHLEPDSVILRDPDGKTGLQILEQNYRNDPVSQELLLSLFEGKTIDFLVHEPNKPRSHGLRDDCSQRLRPHRWRDAARHRGRRQDAVRPARPAALSLARR
ncbi:MAG: hypothetical protein WDO13_10590 [Verrucomicrobiota bacterium]